MDIEEAIRSRRTVKAFEPQPVDRGTLEELLELARWAPNHNLTNPWRFRVLGPESLAALKRVAAQQASAACPPGADAATVAAAAATKLDRAPTLVVCTVKPTGDDLQRQEDRDAAAVAAYIVLLGAHARGLAGYWRTPAVLRDDAGRAAAGIEDDEQFVGLLHLGHAKQSAEPPGREPPERYTTFLD